MAVDLDSGHQIDNAIRHLESRAEQLLTERAGILDMIRELRTERDQMGVRHVTVVDREAPRFSTVELARVTDWLGSNAGKASSEIADALDLSQERASKLLLELERRQVVKRTGIKRGTRWWPADRAPEMPSNVTDMRGTVLAAARKLDTFTLAELHTELSSLSEATIRRWLQVYEEEGKIERERVGQAMLYSYVPPEQTRVNRAKRMTPEAEATRHQKRVRFAETTSGRRIRTGRPDVDEMIRKATAQGAVVVGMDGQNHVIVSKDGKTKRLAMTPRGSGNKAKLSELGIRL